VRGAAAGQLGARPALRPPRSPEVEGNVRQSSADSDDVRNPLKLGGLRTEAYERRALADGLERIWAWQPWAWQPWRSKSLVRHDPAPVDSLRPRQNCGGARDDKQDAERTDMPCDMSSDHLDFTLGFNRAIRICAATPATNNCSGEACDE
jgi:hypothetical protein